MRRRIVPFLALGFCAFLSQNAIAQSNLGLKAAGVELGIVSTENLSATPEFGAFADLGTLAPNIRLMSHLELWSHSEDMPFGGTATFGDVALRVRGEYEFVTSSPRVQPFVGAGLGLHFLHAKVEDPLFGTADDSSTKLGLDLGGGFVSPVNPKVNFIGEGWYGVVDGLRPRETRAAGV